MILMLCVGLILIPLLMERWLAARGARALARPLDLGLVVVAIGVLYALLPLMGIQLAAWDIGSLSDERFSNRIPAEEDVEAVGAMYFTFLMGFALAYLRTLVRLGATQPHVAQRSSQRDVAFVLLLLVAIKVAVVLTRLALGVQAAEDYIGSYLELASQPLIVRQLYGVLASSELPASILAIVVITAGDHRLRTWIVPLLALQVVIAVLGGGSRTLAFSCVLAYMVARSMYDPNLKFATIVAAGITALLLFLAGGALRHATISSEQLGSLYLLQGGEFLSVFLNALDLLDRLRDIDIGALRLALYLVDLLRFVPQQLVGDLKLEPAAFYVTTFYPDFADAGGGLAFGAVAEAVLGFGVPEALVRGFILGYLFARVRNACLQKRLSLIRAFVYTWFVVLAYQCIRDTTLSIFPRFFFQVVPVLLVIYASRSLRSRGIGSVSESRQLLRRIDSRAHRRGGGARREIQSL